MTRLHSERLGHEVHLGKQPATHLQAGAVMFADVRKAAAASGIVLPPLPGRFGHGGDFKPGEVDDGTHWGMLGNGPDPTVPAEWTAARNGCGDCAWAGPGHEEMEAAKAAGRPVPRFSGRSIVEQYAAYSRYDPVTGVNDNGSNVQDVIAHRQQHGIYDDNGTVYKIGQAVWLQPGNLAELWEATYLLENVGLGFVICAAQMDQLDSGLAWDHVAGSPEEGGHYVPSIGRFALDNTGFVTWGLRWGFTREFYKQQNDEAVAYIDPQRYNQITGQTAEHFSDMDLEKYIVMVAKLKEEA